MKLNKDQLLKSITHNLEYDLADEYPTVIEDKDDLHDYILNIHINGVRIEDDDELYHQAVELIPVIFDEVIEFIDDYCDYGTVLQEQWDTYYSLIAF